MKLYTLTVVDSRTTDLKPKKLAIVQDLETARNLCERHTLWRSGIKWEYSPKNPGGCVAYSKLKSKLNRSAYFFVIECTEIYAGVLD